MSDGPCDERVCVTCSDAATEAVVVGLLDGGLAEADPGDGRIEEVSVALVDARPGDRILVHAGEAIAVTGRNSHD
jgi:hydrogenase expression/formation protein HypC